MFGLSFEVYNLQTWSRHSDVSEKNWDILSSLRSVLLMVIVFHRCFG